MRYGLLYRGTTIPLGPVPAVIGRSAACKVVVDDTEVSRRHARLVLAGDHLMLEDLGSANGIFLNGQKVEGQQKLVAGDRIMISSHEFEVTVESDRARPKWRRPTPRPLRRGMDLRRPSVAQLWEDDDDDPSTGAQTTSRTTQFRLMASAADHLLGEGRNEKAEATIAPVLMHLLAQAKKDGKLSRDEAEPAARYAITIARVNGQAKWLEYCFELYCWTGAPLPGMLMDELDRALEQVGTISPSALRNYLRVLQKRESQLGETDRAGIERLRGLEQRMSGA